MPGNPNPSPETRFKPGNNANPNGRPRGESLTRLLRKAIEKHEIKVRDENGKVRKIQLDGDETVADLIIDALIKGAMKGGTKHASLIFDRTEGKAVQRIEANVSGSNRVVVVRDNGRPTREPLGIESDGDGVSAGSPEDVRDDEG